MFLLVWLDCYNKMPQTGWLTNNRNLFCPGGWKFKTTVPVRSGEGPLPDCRPLVPSHGWRGKRSLGASFIKALIPLTKAPPLWPNHPLQHLLRYWTLGFNVDFGGTHSDHDNVLSNKVFTIIPRTNHYFCFRLYMQ